MDRNYSVYKHTNITNGKVYIGITGGDPEKRWNRGRGYRGNSHMKNAIGKYGWDSFRHDIVSSGLTKEEACELEKALIFEYRSTDRRFGYNSSTGGESGACGVVQSEETKNKRRSSAKKSWANKELRKKQSERLKGIKRSEETKKKISQAKTGNVIISGEQKTQISESLKSYYSNPDNRKHQSDMKSKNKVLCVETNIEYESSHEAFRKTGVCQGNIYACCLGKRKKAGGLHWKFVS